MGRQAPRNGGCDGFAGTIWRRRRDARAQAAKSGALHVAFMFRGVAENDWEALKQKGKILQHTQHENGRYGGGHFPNYLLRSVF